MFLLFRPVPVLVASLLIATVAFRGFAANSPGGTFEERLKVVNQLRRAEPMDWTAFENAARSLQRDFPAEPLACDSILSLINHFQPIEPAKARMLAEELSKSRAPEAFQVRAHGVINRIDLMGKPVAMNFIAVDGREVDLARLKGKVVLIDFWATWCQPCVVDLPKVKAAYEKFHSRGFAIVGVSCDEDKQALQRFIQRQEVAWPSYFDGQRQAGNHWARYFGIIGVPHMLLLDREGRLRFDNVNAGSEEFEQKIESLLREAAKSAAP